MAQSTPQNRFNHQLERRIPNRGAGPKADDHSRVRSKHYRAEFWRVVNRGAAFGASFSPQRSWHLNAEIYGRLRNLKAHYELDERSNVFDNQEGAAIATMFNQYEPIRAD